MSGGLLSGASSKTPPPERERERGVLPEPRVGPSLAALHPELLMEPTSRVVIRSAPSEVACQQASQSRPARLPGR